MALQSHLELFYHFEKTQAKKVFLRQPYGNSWKTLTYAQAGDEARKMTSALRGMGLEKGDHIGIYSKNCYHWILADLAIMMGGFVSVPFYASLPEEQLAEVIKLSDIKLLFVGKLDAWGDRANAVPDDVHIIRFPTYSGNADVSEGLRWTELIAMRKPVTDQHLPALDDIWTILFTSGTTGTPKGVMHSFRNPAEIIRIEKEEDFIGIFRHKDMKFLSFLPLNHVGERIGVELNCFMSGGSISFAESIDTFAANLQDTQPTLIFAVPRIWTKFYQGVISKMPASRLDLLLKLPIINGIIRTKIKTALGLGDAKIVATGAAITPEYLKIWYANLGIHLLEAYGMTEVCGCIANSPSLKTPADSVGQVVPQCEVKIDKETGEILMKAPYQMLSYYKDEEKTAEVLKNGWIHSGDRGTIDENGFIRVIGRVSDAFKTSKGQFITPNPIEEELAGHDYVEQVCIAGLGMPQPIALVILSEVGAQKNKEEVLSSFKIELDRINSGLAGYQKISTIIINKETWSESNNLLTPTMKIRRGAINDRYANNFKNWHDANEHVIFE
ncbi:MAG: long-chain acyl-CoA synthetase [Limisphaerales bacterium]|jgi:long-chain acyl-CoA synthetase